MNMDTNMNYDDFLDLTLEELRFYLRQRGHKISGSKRDLAARPLVSHENGDSPKSIESLKQDILKENKIMSFHFSKLRIP